jgi:hypothetical protein
VAGPVERRTAARVTRLARDLPVTTTRTATATPAPTLAHLDLDLVRALAAKTPTVTGPTVPLPRPARQVPLDPTPVLRPRLTLTSSRLHRSHLPPATAL